MDLPALPAAAFALAALTLPVPFDEAAPPPRGAEALLGAALWATEDPVPRWGETLRAEDLRLERLGRIIAVEHAPTDGLPAVTVAVGGLWGYGAQEVRVSPDRLRLLPTDAGGQALVVDLSATGAEPPSDAAL